MISGTSFIIGYLTGMGTLVLLACIDNIGKDKRR